MAKQKTDRRFADKLRRLLPVLLDLGHVDVGNEIIRVRALEYDHLDGVVGLGALDERDQIADQPGSQKIHRRGRNLHEQDGPFLVYLERLVFQVVFGPACFRCRLRRATARCLLLSKHATTRRQAHHRRNQDAKDRARQPSDGASDIFSHFSSIPFVRVMYLFSGLRLTSDFLIFGDHVRRGVIRTLVAREGASGIPRMQ